GYGLATAIFWDEVSPSVKPFDPENLLIFATGPLCGTPVPGSARVVVAGRSPSTYPRFSYTRSNIGGEWGPNLKYSGYDAIVVKGKASEPVYLWINDGNVEFRRATKLWGLDAYTVQDKIKAEVGQNEASVAAIGKAGENMVSFACIIHRRGHAAGQGGFGAIMGSKNLKAIAVYGRR
ncbi:MAG: aldehyde ferredoxin oxidoreductase N-terminal domain-containing protein, partial [Desulfurococcaceae archaeon]